MSTVSSNVDLNTKYQKVAAEYAKLRTQVVALKSAIIDEKSKSKQLEDDSHEKEIALRKLCMENEGLQFRNAQLLKRVEYLQNEADLLHRTSTKKQHAASHNQQQRKENSFDRSIFEAEIINKCRENEELHSKISSLESEYSQKISELNEYCARLKKENTKLSAEIEQAKSSSSKEDTADSSAKVSPDSTQKYEDETDMKATARVLCSDAAKTVLSMLITFINFLQLLEQRSNIYPHDEALEKLPKTTIAFSGEVLKTIDILQDLHHRANNVLQCWLNSDDLEWRIDYTDYFTIFRNVITSMNEWKDLFGHCVAQENRLSWTGGNLLKRNEEWKDSFLEMFQSFSSFSDVACDDFSIKTLLPHLNKIDKTLLECRKTYSEKIFIENRLPTATKRLRCVNECIEKCLDSLHKNWSNCTALLYLINQSDRLFSSEQKPDELSNVMSENAPNAFQNEMYIERVEDSKNKSELFSVTNGVEKHNITEFMKHYKTFRTQWQASVLNKHFRKLKISVLNEGDDEKVSNPEAFHIFYEELIDNSLSCAEYLESQAMYFENECEELVKKAVTIMKENEELGISVAKAKSKIVSLEDDLEITRKGYEEQLKTLHEHMSKLNVVIDELQNSQKKTSNDTDDSKQLVRRHLFKSTSHAS